MGAREARVHKGERRGREAGTGRQAREREFAARSSQRGAEVGAETTPAHPDSVYSPAEEHAAADGVPVYPAAHALPVNVTAKLGTSSTSVSMT